MTVLPGDPDEIRRIWQGLTEGGAHSFFLSWPLLGVWLSTLPDSVSMYLWTAGPAASPEACCLLGVRRLRLPRRFARKAAFVNASGWTEYDDPLWIEYNAIPVMTGGQGHLERLLAALPAGCDEVVLPGLDVASFPGSLLDGGATTVAGFEVVVDQRLPCHFVDLTRIRNGQDYPALLSANTRGQLRRCYRLANAWGTPELEVAAGIEQALDIFGDLLRLHRQGFDARGKVSHFATDYSRRFHERLIRHCLPRGEVQLLRLTSGHRLIGCLYNFIDRDRACYFQGGFAYTDDNRFKPGLICHAEAIRHNAALGLAEYDFLAGAERYKASLATGSRWLVWARLQKPRLRFRLEAQMLRLAEAARDRMRRDWGPSRGTRIAYSRFFSKASK